jgi:hypothetical protein
MDQEEIEYQFYLAMLPATSDDATPAQIADAKAYALSVRTSLEGRHFLISAFDEFQQHHAREFVFRAALAWMTQEPSADPSLWETLRTLLFEHSLGRLNEFNLKTQCALADAQGRFAASVYEINGRDIISFFLSYDRRGPKWRFIRAFLREITSPGGRNAVLQSHVLEDGTATALRDALLEGIRQAPPADLYAALADYAKFGDVSWASDADLHKYFTDALDDKRTGPFVPLVYRALFDRLEPLAQPAFLDFIELEQRIEELKKGEIGTSRAVPWAGFVAHCGYALMDGSLFDAALALVMARKDRVLPPLLDFIAYFCVRVPAAVGPAVAGCLQRLAATFERQPLTDRLIGVRVAAVCMAGFRTDSAAVNQVFDALFADSGLLAKPAVVMAALFVLNRMAVRRVPPASLSHYAERLLPLLDPASAPAPPLLLLFLKLPLAIGNREIALDIDPFFHALFVHAFEKEDSRPRFIAVVRRYLSFFGTRLNLVPFYQPLFGAVTPEFAPLLALAINASPASQRPAMVAQALAAIEAAPDASLRCGLEFLAVLQPPADARAAIAALLAAALPRVKEDARLAPLALRALSSLGAEAVAVLPAFSDCARDCLPELCDIIAIVRRGTPADPAWFLESVAAILVHFQAAAAAWAVLQGDELLPFVPAIAGVLRLVGGDLAAVPPAARALVNGLAAELAARFCDCAPLFVALFGYLADLARPFPGEAFALLGPVLAFVHCPAFVPTAARYQKVVAAFADFAVAIRAAVGDAFAGGLAAAAAPYGLPPELAHGFAAHAAAAPGHAFHTAVLLFLELLKLLKRI